MRPVFILNNLTSNQPKIEDEDFVGGASGSESSSASSSDDSDGSGGGGGSDTGSDASKAGEEKGKCEENDAS